MCGAAAAWRGAHDVPLHGDGERRGRGALGVGLTCSIARYGLAHRPPKGTDATEKACIMAGAFAGGAASFYGSSESEDKPGLESWAVVSLGSAAAAAIITGLVIALFD